MHGPPDILAARVNIAHNLPMAVPMMRPHRHCAARDPTPRFLQRRAVTALATLRRIHAEQALAPLAAGQRVAIHRRSTLSATSRSRAACATATPWSATSLTA